MRAAGLWLLAWMVLALAASCDMSPRVTCETGLDPTVCREVAEFARSGVDVRRDPEHAIVEQRACGRYLRPVPVSAECWLVRIQDRQGEVTVAVARTASTEPLIDPLAAERGE